MKIAHKLTPAHLNPKGFQAMNVPLATEVFSHNLSVAMAIYQPICDKLKDSTPTQKFIDLVFRLIEAMSSRIPRDALHAEGNCHKKQAILEFLQFLGNWENLGKKIPVSRSTSVGFKVTLRGTLEILHMLKNECGYKYLVTATLSQDPLERFFSVMRHSCGGNDHPDPKMFALVYRLASTFSLIRPPKGCNVPGHNLLKNFMQPVQVLINSNKERELWLQHIDHILEGNEPQEGFLIDEDHNYNEAVTSDLVQSYIAGYITRKIKKNIKCLDCLATIHMNQVKGHQIPRNDLINKISLNGGLTYPSDELFQLTKQLEKVCFKSCEQRFN